MAVYAVGDVQGCYAELQALLGKIGFDAAHDRLWFTGDLVNRGPESLETLRFVQGLGEAAVTVLGNHDLHLLAAASGIPLSHNDHTLDAVLEAPDRDALIAWLRRQPLLHHDAALNFTMLHAGLPPQWDLPQAQRCAAEVEAALRGEGFVKLIEHMRGNEPGVWREDLAGYDRLRFIINCLTRLRYCDRDGHLDFRSKGPPGTQPEGLYPWYAVPGRASAGQNIVFGHWSTLRDYGYPGIYPIDSACLWGGALTALRIDTPEPQRIDLPCPGEQTTKGY
jgi:bis(5'-nucleosyl)-tetraphosphatase (symmetrical)